MSDLKKVRLREVHGVPIEGDHLIEKGVRVVSQGHVDPNSPPPGSGLVPGKSDSPKTSGSGGQSGAGTTGEIDNSKK